MTKVLKATLVAASLCTSTAFLAPASATDLFTSGVFNCATIDCGSTTFSGTVNTYRASATGEHVLKFYAQAGSCLRLSVISQDIDLEMNVIAPNPSTRYVDDDGGDGVLPRVVINNAPNTGWYTVVLHHFAGSAQQGNFTMRAGRYVTNNNPNCLNPTPTSSPVSSLKPGS
jgi:hypothetical protein